MDKLKEQLGPALKHAFWIGLGVALLGSLACWWLATSTIASQTETWASTINAKYGDMNQLQGKASTHPNSFSHKQMEANIDRLKTSVFEAWKSQYDRQTAIFVWPTQLLEETRAAFKPLHPIETTVAFPTPPDKEVPTHLRNDYGRYIEPRMNELAAIIGAKWKAAFKDPVGGGFGAGMGMESGGGSMMSIGPGEGYGMPANPAVPAEPPPLVDWTVGSQQELISQIFPWRKQTPTTLDVLYSQESLWILEAVLNVIKDVNDQGSKFQPPVKRIDRLSLGRGAGTLSGSVITTLNPTPMTGGMGGDGGYMSSSDSSMGGSGYGSSSSESSDLGMGGTSSAPSGVPAGPTVDPADKRYVDNKYDPIDAARLRGALTAADGNPTNADLVVAKRFPVKLKLFMDQRRIIPFLTACGNANLMLEIRQVRVAAEGTGAATGSGSGSEGGSEMGSMSGMSGMSSVVRLWQWLKWIWRRLWCASGSCGGQLELHSRGYHRRGVCVQSSGFKEALYRQSRTKRDAQWRPASTCGRNTCSGGRSGSCSGNSSSCGSGTCNASPSHNTGRCRGSFCGSESRSRRSGTDC